MSAALPRHGEIAAGCHRCVFRVYYEDTDAGGVVYYANYLKIAERARTEMLRCLGVEQEKLRREAGIGLVVRRCTADFIAPARLDDELTVLTRLAAQGGAALELAQAAGAAPRRARHSHSTHPNRGRCSCKVMQSNRSHLAATRRTIFPSSRSSCRRTPSSRW